jgi:hypothetical protein
MLETADIFAELAQDNPGTTSLLRRTERTLRANLYELQGTECVSCVWAQNKKSCLVSSQDEAQFRMMSLILHLKIPKQRGRLNTKNSDAMNRK